MRRLKGFTGEQVDGNGLVYLRARYYAPWVGRFSQRELWQGSAQHPPTLNAYAYTLGNPANHVDYNGCCTSPLTFLNAELQAATTLSPSGAGLRATWEECQENLNRLLSWGQSPGDWTNADSGTNALYWASIGPVVRDVVVITAEPFLAGGRTHERVCRLLQGASLVDVLSDPQAFVDLFTLGSVGLAVGMAAADVWMSIRPQVGMATGEIPQGVVVEEISSDSQLYRLVRAKGGVQYGEQLYGVVMRDGEVVAWLEEGHPTTGGWSHIVMRGHIDDLASAFGLTTEVDIQRFILRYAGEYAVPGVKISLDIPVVESMRRQLHLEIGANGFIVTAYPK